MSDYYIEGWRNILECCYQLPSYNGGIAPAVASVAVMEAPYEPPIKFCERCDCYFAIECDCEYPRSRGWEL